MAAMRTEPQLNTFMVKWHCLYHVTFLILCGCKWPLNLKLRELSHVVLFTWC